LASPFRCDFSDSHLALMTFFPPPVTVVVFSLSPVPSPLFRTRCELSYGHFSRPEVFSHHLKFLLLFFLVTLDLHFKGVPHLLKLTPLQNAFFPLSIFLSSLIVFSLFLPFSQLPLTSFSHQCLLRPSICAILEFLLNSPNPLLSLRVRTDKTDGIFF